MLLNSGETSQSSSAVQQTTIDVTRNVFDLLMHLSDLIGKLRQQINDKLRQQVKKQTDKTGKTEQQPDAAQPSELTPQEQQSVNELCAQGLMHVLEEHGKEVATDRGIHKVYEAEGFVISKDVFDDLTPTYTVTARGEAAKEVFSFQTDVNGKLVILDSPYALSDPQKLQLLEGMQAQIQQQWDQSRSAQAPSADLTGIQWAQQQVDRYGDFAPAGARAVVIADKVLADQQPPALIAGSTYSFAKRQDGAISVSHVSTEDVPLYRIHSHSSDVQFNPSAREEYTAQRHDLDASRFKSMYSTLFPGRAMPSYERSQPPKQAQHSDPSASTGKSKGKSKGQSKAPKPVDLER